MATINGNGNGSRALGVIFGVLIAMLGAWSSYSLRLQTAQIEVLRNNLARIETKQGQHVDTGVHLASENKLGNIRVEITEINAKLEAMKELSLFRIQTIESQIYEEKKALQADILGRTQLRYTSEQAARDYEKLNGRLIRVENRVFGEMGGK